MVDISRYDIAVVEWAESVLRDHLAATITAMNAEIAANASFTDITIPTPPDDAIQARAEQDIDERGHRPQHEAEVWLRVISDDDNPQVAIGLQETEFTLVVASMCTTTDNEDGSTATVQPTGYKRCAYLARAVQHTLMANIDCAFGIYDVRQRSGSRIPRATRSMPATHVSVMLFSVLMKTRRSTGVPA